MDGAAENYRRFLDGDNSGLEQIIRAYKDGLILYLNTYVRDMAVAEELTEETFVKLVLKRPRFLNQSAFKTWLYAIAANIARDYLRHRKVSELSLEECPEISADEEDLELSYIKQEEEILLHRAMRKLKQEYWQVLWLIYFEEFSQKETARIMRKSVHNVEVLVSRARKALKEKLLQEGYKNEKP